MGKTTAAGTPSMYPSRPQSGICRADGSATTPISRAAGLGSHHTASHCILGCSVFNARCILRMQCQCEILADNLFVRQQLNNLLKLRQALIEPCCQNIILRIVGSSPYAY